MALFATNQPQRPLPPPPPITPVTGAIPPLTVIEQNAYGDSVFEDAKLLGQQAVQRQRESESSFIDSFGRLISRSAVEPVLGFSPYDTGHNIGQSDNAGEYIAQPLVNAVGNAGSQVRDVATDASAGIGNGIESIGERVENVTKYGAVAAVGVAAIAIAVVLGR